MSILLIYKFEDCLVHNIEDEKQEKVGGGSNGYVNVNGNINVNVNGNNENGNVNENGNENGNGNKTQPLVMGKKVQSQLISLLEHADEVNIFFVIRSEKYTFKEIKKILESILNDKNVKLLDGNENVNVNQTPDKNKIYIFGKETNPDPSDENKIQNIKDQIDTIKGKIKQIKKYEDIYFFDSDNDIVKGCNDYKGPEQPKKNDESSETKSSDTEDNKDNGVNAKLHFAIDYEFKNFKKDNTSEEQQLINEFIDFLDNNRMYFENSDIEKFKSDFPNIPAN